jgi:hypothetical protein
LYKNGVTKHEGAATVNLSSIAHNHVVNVPPPEFPVIPKIFFIFSFTSLLYSSASFTSFIFFTYPFF